MTDSPDLKMTETQRTEAEREQYVAVFLRFSDWCMRRGMSFPREASRALLTYMGATRLPPHRQKNFAPRPRAVKQGKDSPVRCLDTGEEFPSIKAAELSRGRRFGLSQALRFGRLWHGQRWERMALQEAAA